MFGREKFGAAIDNIKEAGGIPPQVLREIMATDDPARVLYTLGTDMDKMSDVMSLPMGKRLAAFIKMSEAPAEPAPAKKKISDAPAPTTSVGSHNTADATTVLYDDKTEDDRWYQLRMQQKLASKGRAWSINR